MTAKATPSATRLSVKRQVYCVVLPLLAVAVLATYLVDLQNAQATGFNRLVLPILTVCLLAASLAFYLRKPDLIYVERFIYSLLVTVFIGKFTTSIYLSYGPTGSEQELVQLYVWSPTIFILAYVLFEQRAALLYTVSVYGLALLAGLTAAFLASGGVPGALPGGLNEFYLSYALYLGVLYSFSFSRSKITRLHAQLAHLERLAHHDVLTDKPNRRALVAALSEELALSERHYSPCSLILLDIDHFKRVNDTHGHDAGDKVLIATANLAATSVRDTDLFGRWGGEEFLIIAPRTGLEGAAALAERLRHLVAAHAFEVGTVTASFGVASYQPGDSVDSLVKRADEALYASKKGGRNRVEAFMRKFVEQIPLPELGPPPGEFKASVSKRSEQLDRGTVRWLARFGVAPKRDLYRLVSAIRPGYLATTIHREASQEVAQLIADWYLWMFLYDDRCDESEIGQDPERLQAVNIELLETLAGASPGADDELVLQLLSDLGTRLRSLSTPEWFARFCPTVKAYLSATVWEASNRTRHSPPELATYLALRPVTGGLTIDTAFIEFADDIRLPQEVREHPSVVRLTQLAEQAVCWANDLFSLNKEVHHQDVHNLVFALQQERDLTLIEATHQAAQMYHQAVADFREGRTRLPSFGAADPRLERYLEVLEARIQSNLAWSQSVARYRPTESVPMAA